MRLLLILIFDLRSETNFGPFDSKKHNYDNNNRIAGIVFLVNEMYAENGYWRATKYNFMGLILRIWM